MSDVEEIDPMLTTRDVAEMLNVHINTVRRWSNRGVLKAYRITVRGDRRFRRADIVEFLLQRLEEEGLGSDVRVSQLFNEELRSDGKPAPMTSQSMRGDNR
jgi:excisionase family DNA binding protein